LDVAGAISSKRETKDEEMTEIGGSRMEDRRFKIENPFTIDSAVLDPPSSIPHLLF
jgi:hypothetical protein